MKVGLLYFNIIAGKFLYLLLFYVQREIYVSLKILYEKNVLDHFY